MDVDAVLAGLEDPGTPEAERRELAAALVDCPADDVPRVESVLFALASSSALGGLAEACAGALGSLWVRHERLSLDLLQELAGAPREFAVGTLCNERPDWRETLQLLGFA